MESRSTFLHRVVTAIQRWGDAGGYTGATYWTSCAPARRGPGQGKPPRHEPEAPAERGGRPPCEAVEPVPPRKAPSEGATRPYRSPTQVG